MYSSSEDLISETKFFSKQKLLKQGDAPVTPFFALVVFIEFCVIVLVAVLAYYLRFTDAFQVYHGNIKNCSNTQHEPFREPPYLYKLRNQVFYSVLIVVPVGLILSGEVLRIIVADKVEKTLLLGSLRFPVWLRRLVRFIGIFILGLLLTSLLTDTLKCLTGRPRPNFCQDDLNADPKRRDITSFPSFHSSMSTFSATFACLYVHFRFSVSGVYTLRPILMAALTCAAFLVCWQRLHSGLHRWDDVLAGSILGLSIGLYQGICMSGKFQESTPGQEVIQQQLPIAIPRIKCRNPLAQAVNDNVSLVDSQFSLPYYSAY